MNNHQIQLIDNTYNVSDAKEVLFSLLTDKMEFLKLQKMSRTERFGSCPEQLTVRLEALRKEKARLTEMFAAYAHQDDVRFEIDCIVDIKINKNSEATV